MFKQIVFFFCLAMLGYGAWEAYLTLAPLETKIRWTIEGAAEAFNKQNKDDCLAFFAHDFKDSSQDNSFRSRVIDKQLLAQGLDYMFQNRIEAETGALLYKVVPVLDTLQIKKESDIHASAQLRLLFRLKMGHTWTDVWSVDVKAGVRKQGRRWVISRTSLRTLYGSRIWSWE